MGGLLEPLEPEDPVEAPLLDLLLPELPFVPEPFLFLDLLFDLLDLPLDCVPDAEEPVELVPDPMFPPLPELLVPLCPVAEPLPAWPVPEPEPEPDPVLDPEPVLPVPVVWAYMQGIAARPIATTIASLFFISIS